MTKEGPHEWTPLMLSCVRAPLDVIAMLCHAEPTACLISDKAGSLPIHFCANWRRGPFVEVLYNVLVEAAPESIQIVNIWGQTPLHSLLDSNVAPPVGALRIMMAQREFALKALMHPDKEKRLPLHIACAKNLPSEYIQALVKACPESTFIADKYGDLPCHILHHHGNGNLDSIEALLIPLAVTALRRTASVSTTKPSTMVQLENLTKQAQSQHSKDDVSCAPSFTSPAQVACQTFGHAKILPIHIAAHHGVKLEILQGLCRQYPGGVGIRVPWNKKHIYGKGELMGETKGVTLATSEILDSAQNGTYSKPEEKITEPEPLYPDDAVRKQSAVENNWEGAPMESLENPMPTADDDEPWEEESLNTSPESLTEIDECVGMDTDGSMENIPNINFLSLCALEIFEKGRAAEETEAAERLQDNPLSGEENTEDVLVYFALRSDLLLSFGIEVVDPVSGNRYIDDPIRLRRLERLIRNEARDSGTAPLSETVSRVWSYLANYNQEPNTRKYIKSVGRIITNLRPSGLWKLTVITMDDQDVFVRVACTGRTIAHEAELRAPAARMNHMMKQYWFQYSLTSFLAPIDALSYSATCRLTRAVGVRLLPQVPLRVTEASWEKPENAVGMSPPKPWQRLDVLVTEDCTHTIFLSYYVECKHAEESDDNGQHAFGGMLIVRDDNRRLRPNPDIPWGDAVVASCEVPPISGSLVRLQFPHMPGRSYGLWYYSRGEPGSHLSVSDVRIRQLLHSCNMYGRSPLHLLLSAMADQPPNPRLNLNVSMLLAAKFGSGDSVDDVPLHYALKCGVSDDVLQAIISSNPAALVDTDLEGRTPIHAAFLLSKDEPPALGVIRALLTPPGENAIKMKDSSGRLPIHIAAERGAGQAVLKLLIDAYQDGCYRTNDMGDLPIHLLLKSGLATVASVELLIRPIMSNESICRIGGSRGVNLPLHIAAEYQVSFKVLERLLQTYGEGAERARVIPLQEGEIEKEPQFALDILENAWAKTLQDADEEADCASSDDGLSTARSAAMSDMKNAQYLLVSDLIFVYNPLLINHVTGKQYRSDRERIRRLETMIQREAVQCGEERKINCRAKLSDMAKQGWLFLCTYSNSEDPFDNFAGTVRRILRGLSANAVDVLAHVANPKSLPIPNEMVKDCATPVCKLLIMSRLRFVGRYVLFNEIHPVHKSESCLVMRARDHGLEDEYKRFLQIFDVQEHEIEDDISDAGSDRPERSNHDRPNTVTMKMFLHFAARLGVDSKSAETDIVQLMQLNNTSRLQEAHPSSKKTGLEMREVSRHDDESYSSYDDVPGDFNKSPESEPEPEAEPEEVDELEISKEAFSTFCRSHRLSDNGVRTVVIKFMKTSEQFHREKDVRKSLDLSGTKWPVVPILEDYSVDRIRLSRKRDIDTISFRDEVAEDAIAGAPESTDELYALDIQEKNASVHNFALYRYAVVMPAGDRDLGEISQHEELGILQIREYLFQIGTALQSLHEQSTIHGDLKMENVVRFGKNLALVDFDSACKFGIKGKGEKMGSGSSKFCTGVLPPEMICRIDLVSDYKKLIQYEEYWHGVSEDAKDLNLLTPDDIQTISSVTKLLLAKANATRNVGKTASGSKTLRSEMDDIYGGFENRNDWKDVLSISLITISFDDLPFSLNRCDGVEEFSVVLNRILFHAKLWKRVKPRFTADEKYAFLIKTYNDIPNEFGIIEKPDTTTIPYELLDPSKSIDVWGFGLLLYSMCSGSSLFHLGFDGDLNRISDFAELYEWDRQKSERVIRSKIEDPLAQDLLMQILVPNSDRLQSMEEVLKHPFFGSPSNLAAQRILEKHEEQQLIIEETVVIKRMTVETKRKIDRAMERQCKIIFNEEKVVVPTCLIVLPYKLELNAKVRRSQIVINADDDIRVSLEIGTYLLDINKATARLYFWLLLKRQALNSHKGTFKARMKAWQKECRARSIEMVANDILKEIGCAMEYKAICFEMLIEHQNVSQSNDYLHDPMLAARRAIEKATHSLILCYESTQYLYLVDEINGIPVHSHVEASKDRIHDIKHIYPISIDPSTSYLSRLFFPFMNLAVMKLTASGGLRALADLLGLPPSYGIPRVWEDGIPGLVHNADKPSSIAEFSVLHEVFRKQLQVVMESPGSESGLSKADVEKPGEEMRHLEDFFRDNDPSRTFAGLLRVTDGSEASHAIWTTESEVSRIKADIEVASIEHKLRELKKEWIKKQKIQSEIQVLQGQVNKLKTAKMESVPSRRDKNQSAQASPQSQTSKVATVDEYPSWQPSSDVVFDPEQAAFNAKMKRERKRPTRRFRPFFGVC